MLKTPINPKSRTDLRDAISILIIEDNSGDELILHDDLLGTKLLIKNIEVAKTLKEAVHQLRAHSFTLIFLDLFLPDSMGIQSIAALSKINSRVPIIICSGLSEIDTARHAIAAGAQDYLIKGDYNKTLLEKTVLYSIERKNITDALEESILKHNLISKATHDMIWDWDLVTNEVSRNSEGWNKIFKSALHESGKVKSDWSSKIHPDDRGRVNRSVAELINNKNTSLFEIDFRIIRTDKTIAYIEDRGYIVRDADGKATRIIGASHDVTDRHKAEEAISLSEKRFKALAQNATDLLAILDVEGNYVYVSPSSTRILGITPETFIGKNAFSFIHPADVERTRAIFDRILKEKFLTPPAFRFKNAAGEWRWIESVITNLIDETAVKGIVVNSRDITDKKLADDEIERSEERFRLMVQSGNDLIAITQKDGHVSYVSPSVEKVLGYDMEFFKNFNSFSLIHLEDIRKVTEEFSRIKDHKVIRISPYRYKHRNGSWRWIETILNDLTDEPGINGIIVNSRDITERKIAEAAAKQLESIKRKEITEAVYAAEEKERTEIGRELHDNVNQLLGATKMYISMARSDEEKRDFLLTNAITFTLDAIKEIRKLSRTLITPEIKEVGLEDSIGRLVDEIMLVHPIKIIISINGFIEKDWEDRMKLNIFRIIQEQISNVIKHAHASIVTISLDNDPGRLLLSITDNGTGFDTTKKKAGVGIANIKSRAQLYNGKLELTSRKGKGTSLRIAFTPAHIDVNEK